MLESIPGILIITAICQIALYLLISFFKQRYKKKGYTQAVIAINIFVACLFALPLMSLLLKLVNTYFPEDYYTYHYIFNLISIILLLVFIFISGPLILLHWLYKKGNVKVAAVGLMLLIGTYTYLLYTGDHPSDKSYISSFEYATEIEFPQSGEIIQKKRSSWLHDDFSQCFTMKVDSSDYNELMADVIADTCYKLVPQYKSDNKVLTYIIDEADLLEPEHIYYNNTYIRENISHIAFYEDNMILFYMEE